MTVGCLSSASRAQVLAGVERDAFDLLVIGGGITGAGVALEAAQRGLSVLLLEARDFASGTSSRSSKLIHGGLRYLALGDVATVRATALERKVIHRLAPHLAEPRWMLVPARSRASLLKMRAGLTTYEKLGAVEERDRHHNWDAEEIARREPTLERETYPWVCAYREYLTDDARLVLANLRGAAAAGAVVLSHAAVRGILLGPGGAAEGAEVECTRSGDRFRVRARCLINAAGPWVDAIRALEDGDAPVRLHLSKGVHVCLPRERLPLEHIVILNAPDRRSIFAIPRDRVVYLGTTDTSYPGGRDWWPRIEREDVAYLLAPLGRYFRVAPPEPEEVVAAWAGLRPLIAEPGKPPTEISRKDEVWVGAGGVVSIAGGKLTGYRPMARATLERAAELAGLSLDAADDGQPLPGGDFDGDLDALAARLARKTGIAAAGAARLVRLYGTEAADVVALGAEPLGADPAVLSGEVRWAVQREAALDLEDVVYRRLRTALYHPEIGDAGLEAIAGVLAGELGWSGTQRAAQLAATRRRMAEDLAFRCDGREGEHGSDRGGETR